MQYRCWISNYKFHIKKSYTLAKKYLSKFKWCLYPLAKESDLNDLFWIYLFCPDLASKLLLWLSSVLKEMAKFMIIYEIIVLFIYLSCLYLPVIYVIIWAKSTQYRGDPVWGTFAKLYVILSAASSNVAYIFIGRGVI